MVLIFVRSSRIADQGVCPDQARISDRTKKEKNAAPEFFALPSSHASIGIRLGFRVFRVWWVLFLVGLLQGFSLSRNGTAKDGRDARYGWLVLHETCGCFRWSKGLRLKRTAAKKARASE